MTFCQKSSSRRDRYREGKTSRIDETPSEPCVVERLYASSSLEGQLAGLCTKQPVRAGEATQVTGLRRCRERHEVLTLTSTAEHAGHDGDRFGCRLGIAVASRRDPTNRSRRRASGERPGRTDPGCRSVGAIEGVVDRSKRCSHVGHPLEVDATASYDEVLDVGPGCGDRSGGRHVDPSRRAGSGHARVVRPREAMTQAGRTTSRGLRVPLGTRDAPAASRTLARSVSPTAPRRPGPPAHAPHQPPTSCGSGTLRCRSWR